MLRNKQKRVIQTKIYNKISTITEPSQNGLSSGNISPGSEFLGLYDSAVAAPFAFPISGPNVVSTESNQSPSQRLNDSVNTISNIQHPAVSATSVSNYEIDVLISEMLGGDAGESRYQSDGFKKEIKEEVVEKEDVERSLMCSEDTDQVEEPWLEYVEEDNSVQYDVSMACVPLLIWAPLLLVAATHGLSPSTLLVGILSLMMAKIMNSEKA